MRAVGIDLSLTGTGLAEIVRRDALTYTSSTVTSKAAGDEVRARSLRINRIVCDVLDFAREADLVVVEGPAYGMSSTRTWDRAWLWGQVIDNLIMDGHLVAIAPPAVVKKFAAGKGNGDKAAVAVGVARLWGEGCQCANDNEWDALALATMGAQRLGIDGVPTRAHHAAALASVAWDTEGAAA